MPDDQDDGAATIPSIRTPDAPPDPDTVDEQLPDESTPVTGMIDALKAECAATRDAFHVAAERASEIKRHAFLRASQNMLRDHLKKG
jgi:hypothetical protein